MRFSHMIRLILIVLAAVCIGGAAPKGALSTSDVFKSKAAKSETAKSEALKSETGKSDLHKSEAAESDVSPLMGIDLNKMTFSKGRFIQKTADGRTAEFTVNPTLQRFADGLFEKYQVPQGAAVMINSKTGRVLTFSQINKKGKKGESIAVDPSPPAASVFKIITTAALLEKTKTTLATNTRYHGGAGKLLAENLVDSQKNDIASASLKSALGRSINAVYAKLSDRRLSKDILMQYARKFRFNQALPFDLEGIAKPSRAEIPSDRLERARASAGFWHTHLSPLHAAMIVQSIAQKGAMLRPYIVDHVEDADGRLIYQSEPKFITRTVSPQTSISLIDAMMYTVERGTARKAFRDPSGIPYLGDIKVAGKTGTLHGAKPYRAYSWFVALAPADKPEVALAVLVVNEPKWRIKAAGAAAQLLKKYFNQKK